MANTGSNGSKVEHVDSAKTIGVDTALGDPESKLVSKGQGYVNPTPGAASDTNSVSARLLQTTSLQGDMPISMYEDPFCMFDRPETF
jgi:hypothetical protein